MKLRGEKVVNFEWFSIDLEKFSARENTQGDRTNSTKIYSTVSLSLSLFYYFFSLSISLSLASVFRNFPFSAKFLIEKSQSQKRNGALGEKNVCQACTGINAQATRARSAVNRVIYAQACNM